ncbi:MAG TPA: DUF4340 domain-containing protein [Polyangiales bacterium]|nr:DUF4340 domain-containing protein [Polyangiales bacterium]
MTAIVVLAGLLALTVFMWNKRASEDAAPPEVTAKVPKIKKDDVTELTVKAPGKTEVTLTKTDGAWKLTAPLSADADKDAVDTALSKLDELTFVAVAATKPENHEKLEVTDGKGVHVVAKQGEKLLGDIWIGTYLSGNTMLRSQGETNVATVKGSMKYAFDKDLKDWRDRAVVDVKSDDVKAISFASKNGTYNFVKEGTEWKQAAGDKPIANYDANKVSSLVSTLVSLRANDFAADGVTADSAGVGATPVGTVTLTTAADAGDSQILLRVGNKKDAGYYATREGKQPIYIVSEYAGERMMPTLDKLQKDEPGSRSNPIAVHPEPAKKPAGHP